MKTLLVIVSICITMCSCKKEYSTTFEAFIRNTSSHSIKISVFSGGRIFRDTTLAPSTTINIGRGVDWGIVDSMGFNSDFIGGMDSAQVQFDNMYRVSHYVRPPVTFSSRYYLYSSLRNIGQYKSYTYSFVDLSKYKRNATYIYTFTEQDYLDAR